MYSIVHSVLFQCEVGDGCIPQEWKCDGEADCHDRSDEAKCGDTQTKCKLNTVCYSGLIISHYFFKFNDVVNFVGNINWQI